MKKRLFALLVATLIVLGVAIPIGAEENNTYIIVADGTEVIVPATLVGATYSLEGINGDILNMSFKRGLIYTNESNVDETIATFTQVSIVGTSRIYRINVVSPTFSIIISDSEFTKYDDADVAVLRQILILADPEPEVTDPEPEVTDPEPEVTDPEPEVTDPEPEVTDPEPEVTADGLTEATANTLRFWEVFWDKIFTYIAHPSYALYDINSPAFTVLALVYAGGSLLLVLDFIKQFFTNFRR